MTFTTVPLTINRNSTVLSSGAEKLLDSLNSAPSKNIEIPTILVGSGVSLWHPTGLPSGQNFTQAMYSVLFENQFKLSRSEKCLLDKIFGLKWNEEFSGMPFEHLMECCPSEEKANRLINRIYTSRRANPVHEALAEGLKNSLIHSIITTNYDSCIDEALDKSGINYAKVVTADQAEITLQNSDLPCYFKIHGSTEPGMEETPMFSLKHEGLLNQAKRQLLNFLTEKRPLVIVGYSGLDFELCPEIERSDITEIVWNELYAEPPSASAERLLEKKGGHLIYGDVHIFIKNWLGTDYLPEKNEDMSGVVKDAVENIFSYEEITLWRVKVLNSLGLPSFVFKAISRAEISAENSYFASVHSGRSHFHAGRYKAARQNFNKAIWQAIRQRDLMNTADTALEMSDAYRSFGAPSEHTFALGWLTFCYSKICELKN